MRQQVAARRKQLFGAILMVLTAFNSRNCPSNASRFGCDLACYCVVRNIVYMMFTLICTVPIDVRPEYLRGAIFTVTSGIMEALLQYLTLGYGAITNLCA